MNLTDLDNAFRELERRADASAPTPVRPVSGNRHRPMLVAASAAAVVAVAAGTGVALTRGGTHNGYDAASPAPTVSPTGVSSGSGSGSPTRAPSAGKTDVPADEAALASRFREILGRSATFTVDHQHSTKHLITGVLASESGSRGFYVLELFDTHASEPGLSTSGAHSVTVDRTPMRRLADGSTLQVDDDFPDGPPDGSMNDAILTRPDGWEISLYTSNVAGKYYGAPVLGDKPALRTDQVQTVVTSPMWVEN